MHISGHETIGLPIPSHGGRGENQKIARHTPLPGWHPIEASPSRAETVELSSQARDVQHIQQIVWQTPDIREQRVAEAANAVQQGTLMLHGSDLASAVLSDPLHTISSMA